MHITAFSIFFPYKLKKEKKIYRFSPLIIFLYIFQCVAQSCRNVLLDVNTTKCGQLVILHEQTLYRLEYGIMNGTVSSEKKIQSKTKNINSMKFEELNSLNLARNHPLW